IDGRWQMKLRMWTSHGAASDRFAQQNRTEHKKHKSEHKKNKKYAPYDFFLCSDLCFLCSVSVSLCKAVCRRSSALAGVLAVAFALTPALGQQPLSSQQELVSKYCVTCHNEKTKTGGLALEKLDADHPAADSETWEKVIRKLRA